MYCRSNQNNSFHSGRLFQYFVVLLICSFVFFQIIYLPITQIFIFDFQDVELSKKRAKNNSSNFRTWDPNKKPPPPPPPSCGGGDGGHLKSTPMVFWLTTSLQPSQLPFLGDAVYVLLLSVNCPSCGILSLLRFCCAPPLQAYYSMHLWEWLNTLCAWQLLLLLIEFIFSLLQELHTYFATF